MVDKAREYAERIVSVIDDTYGESVFLSINPILRVAKFYFDHVSGLPVFELCADLKGEFELARRYFIRVIESDITCFGIKACTSASRDPCTHPRQSSSYHCQISHVFGSHSAA